MQMLSHFYGQICFNLEVLYLSLGFVLNTIASIDRCINNN